MADAKHFRRKLRPPTEVEWSEFENLLGITDSSLSADSSGTPKFEKLYVITAYTADEEDINSGHCVYSVDLNSASHSYTHLPSLQPIISEIDVNSASDIDVSSESDSDTHLPSLQPIITEIDVNSGSDIDVSSESDSYTLPSLEPVVTWDLGYNGAVAILGSKLYFFGGLGYDCTGIWRTSTHIYDMASALSSPKTTYLKIDSLESGKEMKGRKCCPVAVVIGDCKICVFARLPYCTSLFRPQVSAPSFELFDTRDGNWKALPEPMKYDDLKQVYIYSYCVHRSCLIIQTLQGIYGINVDNQAPEWVKLYGSELLRRFPFEGMWAMVDKLLCSPAGVIRRGDLKAYGFPLIPPTDREYLIKRFPTPVLCLGGVNLFIVRGGFSFCNDIPTLLVDILKFDDEALQKLGPNPAKWQKIQSEKSFNFSLCSSEVMNVIACFPVKGIDTSEDDICPTFKEVALESGAHGNEPFVSS